MKANKRARIILKILNQIYPYTPIPLKHKNIFTPHLSVGQVKRRNELDALIAEFQAGWTPLIFQATCVDLIWRNDRPDDIFRVGYSVSLGTGDVQRVKM